MLKRSPEPGEPGSTPCESRYEREKLLLDAVMDTSTDGMLAVDADGKVVAANRRFQELWSIPDELLETRADGALLTHVMSQVLDPEDFRREVTRLYASTEESHDVLHCRDGRVFGRVSRPLPVDGRNGRLWAFRDQTSRHERDKLYRTIVNVTGLCIDVFDISCGHFIEANESACRTLGYTREEYLTLSPADQQERLCPGHGSTPAQGASAHAEDGKRLETRLRRRDGSLLDVAINARVASMRGRDLMVRVWRDVTAERADRIRRDNDAERRRVLIEHARDGIAIFNQSHRIIEANQTFADMLGYDRDELLQLHMWDFEARMTESDIRSTFVDLAKINEIFITRHRRKDGSEYDAEVAIAGAKIDGQSVVITATRDVSEQRHFQEALEAREKVFAAIAAQALDGIVLIDCDTLRLVEFNDAACMQAGYTRAEFALLTVADLTSLPPDLIDTTLERILETGVAEFEVRHRCKDGSWRDIFASNRRVEVLGKPYVAAIWRDITEQKKSVDALRLSEERQRLAVQAGQVGLWDFDVTTGESSVDEIYATMLGENPVTFRETLDEWLRRMHPDDKVRCNSALQSYLEGTTPGYSVEFRVRTVTGAWHWIQSQGQIVERDASGRPLRMLGTHTDIDERKRIEERLQESEFFLRQSQKIGLYGGWRANPRENTVVWTEGIYAILQLPLDYEPDLETGLDYYVPESRARVVENLKRTLLDGEPFSIEVQVRASTGALRWTELRGFPHYSADGVIDYLMGTLQDITERKLADLELQRHRLRLEELVSERTAALESANRRLSQSDVRLNAMFDMSQKASHLSEAELLRHGINEAVRLTDSAIGYLHFVNDDQETLQLVTWSDSTLQVCTAAHDDHYPVSKAGLWADTVRFGVPVVHNDYQQAAGRKGYPAGHTHLVRHLGVPVVDGGRVRMLLGVGNKKTDYDSSDVRELHLIGHDVWRIFLRRRTELQLAEAKESAEAASRAKSTFLANMSHEIRTPLNAITGFAHLVRQSGVSEEQALHLDQIDTAGAHLLEVINQVLDLAKIEAGRFVLDEVRVDVPGIVANVTAMVQSIAQRKGIALVCEMDALPDDCMGDPTRLRQALLNYAMNAAKFTETGRIILRVRVLERQRESVSLRFEVEDTGIGIERETLERLFVEFQQADNSTTRQHRGTGLGLAITRRIAMLMGGEAGVTSEPGVGSLFWFTAVLKRGAPPAKVASGPAVPSARDLVRAEFGGRRVLVVEDDLVNQKIMTMLLQGAGLEVDLAGDGREAVEKARAGGYALILMDMQLPLLDGPAATRLIRATDSIERVPILAMTANAFVEDKAECFAAGMDDFITKPVSPVHLLGTLLQWLRHG